MKPVRPTEMLRTTATQEIRTVLTPTTGCEYREVQILVSSGENVLATLDLDNIQISEAEKTAWYDTTPRERMTTGEVTGLNRVYKLAVLAGGAQIKFPLLPKQSLSLATETGKSDVTLIVSYH